MFFKIRGTKGTRVSELAELAEALLVVPGWIDLAVCGLGIEVP